GPRSTGLLWDAGSRIETDLNRRSGRDYFCAPRRNVLRVKAKLLSAIPPERHRRDTRVVQGYREWPCAKRGLGRDLHTDALRSFASRRSGATVAHRTARV